MLGSGQGVGQSHTFAFISPVNPSYLTMHLDDKILNTLREYAQKIQHPVQIKIYGGEHPKREKLLQFLQQVSSISDLIHVVHGKTDVAVREGLTFELMADEAKSGVLFSGIPGGHEFNSFILALLQVGGSPVKLDEGLQRQIKAIDEPLMFESIISLDCHVCPEVVQAFNQMAILNPNITHEMIDGALHQSLTEERKVQGVPTVFINKKPFASGAVTVTDILEKLGDVKRRVVEPAEDASGESTTYDVAIIGGGPAAVASAIYTARKGLNVVMVAEKIGGQLNDTQAIENFISSLATTGPKLTGDLRSHLGSYPIKVREELRVAKIDGAADQPGYSIGLSTGESIQATTVVLATGARWRELNVPGEKEYIGRGVAYCPHCDGPFFKGKDVTVVGGGNSGVEAALDLAGIAKSVTILEFADTCKADQILLDKVAAASNIRVLTGIATQEILASDGHVSGMRLQRLASNDVFEHATDGVFVQIGLVPNSQFVADFVEKNPFGEILVNDRCQTSREGIFAAGDVTNVPYKQIIVAMGEGAKAGLAAFEYLLKLPSPSNEQKQL